ncbi:MAG TPA: phosphoesterase PA-phosphatase [Comamonadaceae bacterium]|uniref:phosphatase PAP2 family protein n=1 Tax=Pulveribacter sp. TaxID=2678893 RepID=UPI000EE5EEEE|nr:phosphatase PAP2 family protein [Pulveribacter sp.]HCL86521.1 phosphoesterase PA-phosphatase [Comamonadaceae bacterium]
MSWAGIDAWAAPAGAALTLAALGGLFFYLRRPGPPAAPAALGPAACRALAGAGVLAALGLAGLAASMAGLWPGVDGLALDAAVSGWIERRVGPAWHGPLVAFTQLGHVGLLVPLAAAVLLVLLRRRDRLRAGVWLLGTAGAGLWTRAIKSAVARPRPAEAWVAEGGHSFPSGHSAGTLALFGLLVWLLLPHLRRAWRLPLALAALALALGVGASRVLLRVHYASDVLAGWLLALAWGACMVCAAEWALRRRGACLRA